MMLRCIGCGCTDAQPCPDGCAWAAVDEEQGIGLCTNCAVKPLDQLIGEGQFPVEKGEQDVITSSDAD